MRPTSVSLNEEMIREIDGHPLSKDTSRSAVVRVAISQFLEKEKSEKENQNEKGEK